MDLTELTARLLDQFDGRSLRLVMLGLILLVAAAVFSYGLKPQYLQWRSHLQSLEVLEGFRLAEIDVQAQTNALRAEIEALRKRMRGELPEMPLQQLEAYIMGRLQMVSWNSDVELQSVRPGVNQSIRRFDEISFDIEIAGGYHDLFRWLWQLGQQLGFVVVKHFEITPVSYAAAVPQLRAKLNIVFYQPEAAE